MNRERETASELAKKQARSNATADTMRNLWKQVELLENYDVAKQNVYWFSRRLLFALAVVGSFRFRFVLW